MLLSLANIGFLATFARGAVETFLLIWASRRWSIEEANIGSRS